jgi:hypothetical protein
MEAVTLELPSVVWPVADFLFISGQLHGRLWLPAQQNPTSIFMQLK